jgi:hypothetical protein
VRAAVIREERSDEAIQKRETLQARVDRFVASLLAMTSGDYFTTTFAPIFTRS